MYNGIGLVTARGSGTNGYVQRNISAVRKTKEKVPDYHEKEDSAVRAYDPELVEHDRRRQAEVRCMELRDLLEEQDLPEPEIEKKINDFRAKLLAEKKLAYQKDASGRPVVKDSHEFSVAQEQKNVRAKDAFGIRDDFVPGSSLKGQDMPKEGKEIPEMEAPSSIPASPPKEKSDKEKSKKRKKAHKRSRRSSSSDSAASSEEESHKSSKKRKKEKKAKKSKKSHRHRKDSSSKKSRKHSDDKDSDNDVDKNRNYTKSAPISSTCCISVASSESPSDSEVSDRAASKDEDDNSKYSLSVIDFAGHHKFYPSLPSIPQVNGKMSPIEAIERACLPLLANVASTQYIDVGSSRHDHDRHSHRSRSSSACSKYSTSRSRSRSSTRKSNSKSRSRSRTPSVSHSHRSSRSRSKSYKKASRSRSKSHSASSHYGSRSRSRSESRSVASSRSRTHSSHSKSSVHSSSRSGSPDESIKSGSRSTKSDRSRSPSIPRRRGSPSFMERRRITSARKRPIPYKRDTEEWQVSSASDSSDD